MSAAMWPRELIAYVHGWGCRAGRGPEGPHVLGVAGQRSRPFPVRRAEDLTEDRLRVVIERAVGAEAPVPDGDDAEAEADDVRTVTVSGVGERWAGADLSPLAFS
ncbi:hypothetical protein ACQEVS_14730 [Streptomyces sp. CA-181903]|uniref:hypothetical protein n=1 Tax=Streptomyces sp. CA-181903 TaxID=3240055 RepID=UPI003D913AE8